ncbi:MAG: cob(I)yrinic acid a,c-diamide adenosyltransferase [Planctomycetia bacterium]|jgi:cob(I)alamin adenosyltransferase
MKIYTRNGDEGKTDLLGGDRIEKDAQRLHVCGTLDELNSVLGLARAEKLPEPVDQLLHKVQKQLFHVGAELACPSPNETGATLGRADQTVDLELEIDRYSKTLPPLKDFILPGGTRATAMLHLARTVCRRAEREHVTLARAESQCINPAITSYLNRLGDLLFVLARVVNQEANCPDTPWR